MGRHVVGNLTTVSTSVRDFTVTMLGYYFAERVAEETAASDDLNVFLRWEQLSAYARGGGNNDWAFRGTERTKNYWNSADRVRLGADSGSFILSDQKTYGLWGLYSVPSRSSGLVEGSPTRLTAEARQFVEENYLPVLDGKSMARGEGLVDILGKRSVELRPKDRDRVLFGSVAKVLRRKFSSAERSLYVRHLIEGGPKDSTQGGQRLLAEAMKTTFDVKDWQLSPVVVSHLAKQCRAKSGDTGRKVADYLEHIRLAEQLLAPCVSLFAYSLSSDNQRLDDVAVTIRKEWGPELRSVDPKALEAIEPELIGASGERESARRWLTIAGDLAQGDYAKVITQLIDQNREVMVMRGGAAPWLEIRDGKLHVKLAVETGYLPTKKDLPTHWIHSYFLDSLRTVTKELEV
ncbi:hypothetical protein [Candidatus Nitrospira nitrosa]|nr:hypothetical protein [Candidatus Nitrospira nitrosa]